MCNYTQALSSLSMVYNILLSDCWTNILIESEKLKNTLQSTNDDVVVDNVATTSDNVINDIDNKSTKTNDNQELESTTATTLITKPHPHSILYCLQTILK